MATESLGSRLWRLRESRGLTRVEEGHLIGKSERWVYDLEHDKARLDLPTAQVLADCLRVAPAVIFGSEPLPSASHDQAPRHLPASPTAAHILSREQLGTVGDMVDWLAAATRTPADEIIRPLSAEMERLQAAGLPTQPFIPRQNIAEELLEYYGDSALADAGLRPYACDVDGQRIVLSVVAEPGWLGCAVPIVNPASGIPGDRGHERYTLSGGTRVEIDWGPVIDAAIARLASTIARGTHGPIMVNKPLYRLLDVHLSRDSMDARFAIDWFAHYALSMDLLESELLTSMGGPPRRGRTALPLRNHLLQSPTAIRDISHRLCAGGFATLFAVARPASWAGPADFLIVVQRRSARVLNVHGGLSVIPKGFHQHLVDARSEVSVGSTIYRELDEELFGRGDYDEGAGRPNVRLNPHHVERLTAPMRWLTENDACRAECVGLGLNLMTGNYDFACLMCFPDEEFWARFGGDCLPNWEAADVQTYSTADPDGLRELIADERWTNEGLFALLEGLRRLAELYPERVQLPNLEVVH